MKTRARDQSARRRWSRTTTDTYMMSTRVPLDQMAELRRYVEYTGRSITDVVLSALSEYLSNHSPMEDTMEQEGGRDTHA